MTALETPQTAQTREPAPRPDRLPVLTTAELSECTCPEFCERDHERD
jgi:hypothetical protein